MEVRKKMTLVFNAAYGTELAENYATHFSANDYLVIDSKHLSDLSRVHLMIRDELEGSSQDSDSYLFCVYESIEHLTPQRFSQWLGFYENMCLLLEGNSNTIEFCLFTVVRNSDINVRPISQQHLEQICQKVVSYQQPFKNIKLFVIKYPSLAQKAGVDIFLGATIWWAYFASRANRPHVITRMNSEQLYQLGTLSYYPMHIESLTKRKQEIQRQLEPSATDCHAVLKASIADRLNDLYSQLDAQAEYYLGIGRSLPIPVVLTTQGLKTKFNAWRKPQVFLKALDALKISAITTYETNCHTPFFESQALDFEDAFNQLTLDFITEYAQDMLQVNQEAHSPRALPLAKASKLYGISTVQDYVRQLFNVEMQKTKNQIADFVHQSFAQELTVLIRGSDARRKALEQELLDVHNNFELYGGNLADDTAMFLNRSVDSLARLFLGELSNKQSTDYLITYTSPDDAKMVSEHHATSTTSHLFSHTETLLQVYRISTFSLETQKIPQLFSLQVANA